jgi:hypothetical protein
MKITRNHLTLGFLAVVAVLAVLAVAGHPMIPPEAFAGLGMIPFAGEIDTKGLTDLFNKHADTLDAWKKKQDDRLQDLESNILEIAKKAGRQSLGGSAGPSSGEVKHLLTADGRKLPLLTKSQRFADLTTDGKDDSFNLGDFCRDAVIGSRKAASGAALVPTFIGSQIIDNIRAQTVLVEAGAASIMIDGPTNLARLTTDPTVYSHTEGATDIVESDVVATPVVLNPKVLAVLIPLTVELVQDSPNLDALLNVALAQAFAAKVDALGIAALLADTSIPASVAGQDPASWLKVLEAVSSALALNQALPTSHISSPADFISRASQMTGDAAWLGKPPVLASMAELHTTTLTAGTAFFGRFAEAFALAVRSDLRVEVVRHAKATSGGHLLVAHARIGGVVLQPGKLFKQLKTV